MSFQINDPGWIVQGMIDGNRNKIIDAMKGLSAILVIYIHSHNIENYTG